MSGGAWRKEQLGWSWTWCRASERIHPELWWRSTLGEGTERCLGNGAVCWRPRRPPRAREEELVAPRPPMMDTGGGVGCCRAGTGAPIGRS
jgi:hypothetical protein